MNAAPMQTAEQTAGQIAEQVVVAAFYRFFPFPEYAERRAPLLEAMLAADVRGTVLLAAEGVNGGIAGSRAGVDAVLAFLQRDPRLAGMEVKESYAADNPFLRCKVKLRKEIVTMGVADLISSAASAASAAGTGSDSDSVRGTYIAPRNWNALMDDPELLLLDVRNSYETAIGTFDGALIPATESFRQFPDFAARRLDPARHPKVAMFCTGGIRCEKSAAYLKQQGFPEVYQLRGGILKYLEKVPEAESKWRGECFVFDDRVAVNHRLQPGSYRQCHACRMPLSETECKDARYQPGVSCPHCHGRRSPAQTRRYAERARQMALARARGESHLGQVPAQSPAQTTAQPAEQHP